MVGCYAHLLLIWVAVFFFFIRCWLPQLIARGQCFGVLWVGLDAGIGMGSSGQSAIRSKFVDSVPTPSRVWGIPLPDM